MYKSHFHIEIYINTVGCHEKFDILKAYYLPIENFYLFVTFLSLLSLIKNNDKSVLCPTGMLQSTSTKYVTSDIWNGQDT